MTEEIKDPVDEKPSMEVGAEPVIEPVAEAADVPEVAEVAEKPDIDLELRRLSRRGFVTAGIAAAAGLGAYEWLLTRPRIDGVEWPLRRVLETNERLAKAYFSRHRLNPTYSRSRITRPARLNGGLGLNASYDMSAWRLNIEGSSRPASLTLDEIKRLPRRTMITEFRCIEGWSMIVQWTGVALIDVMRELPPPTRDGSAPDFDRPNRFARYVAMETSDGGYYVGLDMKSALHPQTLLAYELNGEPLSWQHGAPLRLAIPVKYGVKNIKRVSTIRYTDVRPADYWAERGYDWYAGL